jgi:UDP-N-acetylmuramate dehydrogenase
MSVRVYGHRPLAPLTTLRVGGDASVLVELEDASDIREVAQVAGDATYPVCLGLGSNVLVSDTGTSQPVLRLTNQGLEFENDGSEHVVVTAQAGHLLWDFVDAMIAEGLAGVETLVGIPGTVGATPVQNVGAYGQEVGDTIVSVHAWDWQAGCLRTIPASDCGFGHRTSIFKRTHELAILSVTFRLRRATHSAPIRHRQVADALDVPVGTRPSLRETARGVLFVRRGKGMVLDGNASDERSAGSVFLSPPVSDRAARDLLSSGAPVNTHPDGTRRVSASWLLKSAGYELGQTVGEGIRISAKHYTLVTDDGATAHSFATATGTVQQKVAQLTGIILTPEPDLIGHEPTYERLIEGAGSERSRPDSLNPTLQNSLGPARAAV